MKAWGDRTQVSDFFKEGVNPTKQQEEFARIIIDYRKAGIYIEPLEPENDNIYWFGTQKVRVTQKNLLNALVLNQKELMERAKSLYKLGVWS